MTDERKLIEAAFAAQQYSYSPYSDFMVGAALLAKSGKIYTGCNIESISYSPSNCAERTAFFKAVSEGERAFTAIAIVGNRRSGRTEQDGWCTPCGVCRQVMLEFCGEDFKIILAKTADDSIVKTLGELLPMGFGPGSF